MTLGQYITAVELAVDWLTDGEMSLDDLPDYADGELALSELHADEVVPETAARLILRANGADWL
jgi:hypothetical protein